MINVRLYVSIQGMITKPEIDKLAEKYETVDFIKDDPIQFPHRYNKSKEDCEIAGFIASLLAYGNRKVFIKKLNELFINIVQNEPYNFILNFEPKILGDFNYRFGTTEDFTEIFKVMRTLYEKDGGLEELFKYAYNTHHPQGASEHFFNFIPVTDYFYSRFSQNAGQGAYFMIPNPKKGGAMKRMCMYLRWNVRKGPVDLGIWKFMRPSELLIPLDTHVARLSREMGLLTRKGNDFKSVLEITENLSKFDPEDPTKYDFAMFGYGVNNK